MKSGSCKPSRCDTDMGDEAPGDGAFKVCFPVPGEAARTTEPSEGALDDPASLQDFEALRLIAAPDDVERPVAHFRQCRLELVPGISAIGEDVAQPWKPEARFGEDSRCAIPVLNVSGVDQGGDQEPFRVGEDVALAAPDLLAGVIP